MIGIAQLKGIGQFYRAPEHGGNPRGLGGRASGPRQIPKFAIGFPDELAEISGKLSIKGGEIEIPNGYDWLAVEIYNFAQELISILRNSAEFIILGYWERDMVMGIKEALRNSFSHAVRQGGKVWLRWELEDRKFIFEIIDEGKQRFNIGARSSGEQIRDQFGDPLAGSGLGMTFIQRCADEVRVVPLLSNESGNLIGNKVVIVKHIGAYLSSPL